MRTYSNSYALAGWLTIFCLRVPVLKKNNEQISEHIFLHIYSHLSTSYVDSLICDRVQLALNFV